MARPYAQRRFDELAQNAEALVALNPNRAEWHDWDEFAHDAARAANAHDEAQTLRACSECHRAHRREYVERYRSRELAPR
ncbi:MAG: hypothetical protein ABI488_02965 [Polyangiaceae bacterium]